MPDFTKTLTEVAKGLKGKPSALLAFICVLASTYLLTKGHDPWVSTLVPSSTYILYQVGNLVYFKHKERIENLKIKRVEQDARLSSRPKRARLPRKAKSK